jgi:hypothetical protein
MMQFLEVKNDDLASVVKWWKEKKPMYIDSG